MEKHESLESVSIVYLMARTLDSGYEGRAVVDAPRTTMSALFGAPDCFPADNRLLFSAEEKSRVTGHILCVGGGRTTGRENHHIRRDCPPDI
jgi:hypothetical protein